MTLVEDYALIGDCQTAALVSRDGSIDWLCLPSFDNDACFAALLGTPEHGRWQIRPACEIREIRRKYRGNTLVLETEYETDLGVAAVIDFMPPRTTCPDLVRIVEGRAGSVPMQLELVIRLDTGESVPWIRPVADGLICVAGADGLHVKSEIDLKTANDRSTARFTVASGQRVPFQLTWYPSHEEEPEVPEPASALEPTERWWEEWAADCTYEGPWQDAVLRSLITLKALTYQPTGGIVAAVTTSLPEVIGGSRNWDYRFCWLRDATLTLNSLMQAGYFAEAESFRDWLVRTVAGEPKKVQPIYTISGERRIPEIEAHWLPGYEDSRPVRLGNGASKQMQWDSYGELMDALHVARTHQLAVNEHVWNIQNLLLLDLEEKWRKPDHGIWEVRGAPHHFTHSKVMSWVAFDRAVKDAENYGLDGPIDRWKRVRQEIHESVCRFGFHDTVGAFTQTYDSEALDASLLTMPIVGFLPFDDPRVCSTVEAIQAQLTTDGFVCRYEPGKSVDPIHSTEGAFLLCTFWLCDTLGRQGKRQEALEIFERLLNLRNDVGLLPEEYDPHACRFLGNFPHAFSHKALINSVFQLNEGRESPRGREDE